MNNKDLNFIECRNNKIRFEIDVPSGIGVGEVSVTFKLGNSIGNDIELGTFVSEGVTFDEKDFPF